MRLYIALDLSHLKIDQKVFSKLKTSLGKKKWIYKFLPFDQLEMPLFALKEMGRDRLQDCISRLHNHNLNHEPLVLKLSGVWAYPHQTEARLLWIGTQQTRELVTFIDHLKEFLADFLSDAEAKDERRAIIPLLRFRDYHHVADLISPYKGHDFGKIQVETFKITELTSGGAFPQSKTIASFSITPSQLVEKKTELLNEHNR